MPHTVSISMRIAFAKCLWIALEMQPRFQQQPAIFMLSNAPGSTVSFHDASCSMKWMISLFNSAAAGQLDYTDGGDISEDCDDDWHSSDDRSLSGASSLSEVSDTDGCSDISLEDAEHLHWSPAADLPETASGNSLLESAALLENKWGSRTLFSGSDTVTLLFLYCLLSVKVVHSESILSLPCFVPTCPTGAPLHRRSAHSCVQCDIGINKAGDPQQEIYNHPIRARGAAQVAG